MNVKILVAFDIKDQIPHKALRIYDANGVSIGYGEIKINEVPETTTLFEHTLGYVTYAATLETDKLKLKDKPSESTKLEKDTYQVKQTDNPKEDMWVEGMIKQMIGAGRLVTLTTEIDLRQEHKDMVAKIKEKEAEKARITAEPVTVQTLVDNRGEEILRHIKSQEEESRITNTSEPTDPFDDVIEQAFQESIPEKSPSDDFLPLKTWKDANGFYYLTDISVEHTPIEDLKRLQALQQTALDKQNEISERIDNAIKEKEKKPEVNFDDFLKGL